MPEKKWLGTWPAKCDVCSQELERGDKFYDCRIKHQLCWGLLCDSCFPLYGAGLGVGYGQEYDTKTLKQTAGGQDVY